MKNKHDVYSESFENKNPKKKKYGQVSIVLNNNTKKKTCEKDIEQYVNGFSETMSTKKKSINASENILLKNNYCINNELGEIEKLRKKNIYIKSLNLIDCNTNNSAEIKMFEKSDKEVNASQKKKSEINALTDNICSIDNVNIKFKKSKKKNKHTKCLNFKELNTNYDTENKSIERTCEEVKYNKQSINDSSTKKNIRQKVNPSLNISLENNSNIDYEITTIKKFKKKKKHNKSLNFNELNINHDTENKTCEEVSEQNINDSDSWENLNQSIKSDINTSSGKNCSIDNENVQTKTPKKKKLNKSLNFKELNANHDTENKSIERTCEEVDKQSINDSNFSKNVRQKIKNPSLDISLESNSSMDDEVTTIKKLKKKKKHNKSLNSIELSTNNDTKIKSSKKACEEDKEKEIDSYFWKNPSQKRKYEISALADIESVPTKTPKKKKNYNKSINTNYDTGDITFEELSENNIEDSESEENLNRVSKYEINASSDISLGNNCSIDNENVQIKTPKKHDNSLNSLEFSINNNIEEINTVKRTNLKSDKNILNSGNNISVCNSKKSKIYNVNITDIVNVAVNNYDDMLTNENNMPVVSDNYNTTSVLKNSQNQSKLKTLLNSMESYNFEDSSTRIETKFNLMKYLKNKDPLLRSHPKFKQINEILSKKIKNIVNKNYQITDSDIVLLKTVGNIILEKIVEKIDSAQDINDLIITLPPESKENKIHFIETFLSRSPSKEKMDIIKKLNPQVKLRVFNAEEDNMIRKYWSKFQKEYNISNILPFLSNGLEMALNSTQRLQFIRYISAGLPNRLLNSVFNRFNILFNKRQDKTSFSEEEDQLIMKVEKCDAIKKKFSVLSLILNRSRLQLYRRCEVLNNQYEKCKKIVWDSHKRQELFTNILLETNTDDWKDLKNLKLKKNTLIKIAENLGKDVTYSKVRNQWNYLYTMLFCEKPIKMTTLKLNILEMLEQQNPKHFSDVNWKEITNKLYPGAKSKLICTYFYSWCNEVPPNSRKSIKDTLFYLRVHTEDKLRKKIQENDEKEFPRLTVQDYDLLVIKD